MLRVVIIFQKKCHHVKNSSKKKRGLFYENMRLHLRFVLIGFNLPELWGHVRLFSPTELY